MGSIKRAACLLAASALSVLGSGAASAAAPPPALGAVRTVTYGLPASVHAGTTVHLWSWITWTPKRKTSDTVVIEDSGFSLWNKRTNSCSGARVSFLNPITHQWQTGKATGRCTVGMDLAPLPTFFKVPAGKWVRIDYEVVFSSSAPTGTWGIAAQPVSSYGIVTPSGQGVDAVLTGDFWQTHYTRVYT